METNEFYKKKITKIVDIHDYVKGLRINPNDVYLYQNQHYDDSNFNLLYRVKSSNGRDYYFCRINVENGNIYSYGCNCPQFYSAGSCKHLAACLIKDESKLFFDNSEENILKISSSLLNSFKSEKKERKIKEEVFVEYHIRREDSYYRNIYNLFIKIGKNKMYSASNKLRSFLLAYRDNNSFSFGKSFTYDPDTCFFNKENKELLDYLSGYLYEASYGGIDADRILNGFLNIRKNAPLFVEEKEVKEIRDGIPVDYELAKENEMYKLRVLSPEKDLYVITEDYSFYDGILYKKDEKSFKFFDSFVKSKLDEIVFKEKDLDVFLNNVVPLIRDHLTIDSSLDIKISNERPIPRFYFDLKGDNVRASVKFLYNEKEYDYFENSKDIIRDKEYEDEVVNELYNYRFVIDNDKIYISDLDSTGEFLEYGLKELNEKYEVYTTEAFKKVSVNKNNKVRATFNIGTDNIMHYDFSISDISDSEVENILKSLKNNRKYYRLKNGDILNLDNDELKELEKLTDDLDLSYKQLKENGGKIPKYYALYLDSLKNNRYSIIKTDNSFNKFIENFKKYKDSDLKLSKDELDTLRDYQVSGVKWLYTLNKCGFSGILADEMGLGKSIQTIVFIRHLLKEDENSKFLIVVPTSLIYNWKNEFDKFGEDIKVELINEHKDNRIKKLETWDKSVYVTTYGLLREDLELYKDKHFKLVIIDEAQNIKNPKTGIAKAVKEIERESSLALTGTPIENSVNEVWSIFDFLMPGFLGSLVNFSSRYRVNNFDEETDRMLGRLNIQIKPFILRRKKKDVIKDLPDKIENNIYIDLSEKEMKLYASEVKNTRKRMEELIEEQGFLKAQFEILKLLTRLRQLSIDPRLVYENYTDTSSKTENLMKVLEEVINNGHKVLLFTNFRGALDLVRKELSNKGLTSYTIDGSVPSKKRQELVDSFNKDDTNVFLIMLKSGGTGLNLTSADIVIHLDLWWNPQAENQATDRTHRIGQTKTVEVIKFIAKGTIDEKILELQEKKKLLSDKLIENDEIDYTGLSKLDEKDIKNLLSLENSEE